MLAILLRDILKKKIKEPIVSSEVSLTILSNRKQASENESTSS
jgi:hypothetical protein